MQMQFVLRDYCVTELQASAIKIANEPHVFFSHLVLVVEFNLWKFRSVKVSFLFVKKEDQIKLFRIEESVSSAMSAIYPGVVKVRVLFAG